MVLNSFWTALRINISSASHLLMLGKGGSFPELASANDVYICSQVTLSETLTFNTQFFFKKSLSGYTAVKSKYNKIK